MAEIVLLENKAINDAFKVIVKYLVPDDVKISFTIQKFIERSRFDLIQKISEAPTDKQEKLIKKHNLNKYEELFARLKNPINFYKDAIKIYDEFEDTYAKGNDIILQLIKIQHDIKSFGVLAHELFEKVYMTFSFDAVLVGNQIFTKMRNSNYIAPNLVWTLEDEPKAYDIIQ